MTQSDRRLLSLVFLSVGVLGNFGFLSSKALACVLISVGLAIESFSERRWGPALPRWTGVVLPLVLGGTTVLYDRKLTTHPVFVATFALLAAAILLYSLVRQRVARAAAFALAGVSALAGIVANMTWGFADIDVFHFQQDASQALLNGHNPYSPVVRSPEYVAPGVHTYLHLHFPYGPILPVLEAPFRLLGDIRVLHIVAALITSIAVLVLAHRAGTLERSACVVMAFPLTAGMVLFSWVDIITMAGLAVWMVAFRSHPRIATFALVLALGAKPTTLIALVPVFFWSVRARRQVIIAAILAALFAVPFAIITGVSQFYYNVLGVQLEAFPRPDALTVNAFLAEYNLPVLPFAASAVVVAAATVLVLWRRPKTYGDLLTGTAILASVSFLVAKWAFFNYYYIPAVLLMLAIAGNGLAVDVPEMISPPALFLRCLEWVRGPASRLPGLGRLPGTRSPGENGRERAA
jgi:Glycosyltransferase family 87